MATKQQIISRARVLINQTDSSNSDFTDAVLTGYANEGIKFLATLVRYPRDLVSIQAQEGVPAYNLPSDFMLLRTAYFGNQATSGDLKALIITTEEALSSKYASWMESNVISYARPDYIIILDRKTALLYPTPSTEESVSGKKLHIGYVYYPADLSADGDVPDLPLVYHDLIPIYVQYKCYAGVLTKQELATPLFEQIMRQAKVLEPSVTKELDRISFQWATDDNPNVDEDGILIP